MYLSSCELHPDCVVVYSSRLCPLCEIKRDFEEEKTSLETTIDDLESENSDLKDQLDKLENG